MQVVASLSATQNEILKFVVSAENFIQERLRVYEEHEKKYPPKQFVSGESFLFQGRMLKLCISEFEGKRPQIVFSQKELFVFLPVGAGVVDIKKLVIQNIKKQAAKLLLQRLAIYTIKIGYTPERVLFRGQKTVWGTMRSNGLMTLNWKLILAPLEVMDYIVIHEICHMPIPSHSKSFWKMVESFDPKFREHKQWLIDHAMEFRYLD